MGVHGNGLTALLWMKPSNRATVMEFYYGNGFTQDYEWTTRALGIKHYGFWNNKLAMCLALTFIMLIIYSIGIFRPQIYLLYLFQKDFKEMISALMVKLLHSCAINDFRKLTRLLLCIILGLNHRAFRFIYFWNCKLFSFHY